MVEIALLAPCYVSVLRPSEVRDARSVLEALGDDVEVVEGRCCGQPAFNSGYHEEARRVGRQALRLGRDYETIVVPSGSCTSMIQHYLPTLWEENRRDAAEQLASRFTDFATYVASHQVWRSLRPRLSGVIAYHDSCHGRRELGSTATIASLLAHVEELEVRRLAREDECCGFGGSFSVKLPEVSGVMAGWKVEDIIATGARAVVSGDTSCLAHIQTQARERGYELEAWSLAGLLARALG